MGNRTWDRLQMLRLVPYLYILPLTSQSAERESFWLDLSLLCPEYRLDFKKPWYDLGWSLPGLANFPGGVP